MTQPTASWGPKLVTREKFEEHTKPRLMLFMSIDMENSTRLKQSYPRHHSHEWVGTVVHFLEVFPTILQAARDEIESREKTKLEPLSLWKFQGDDIIFAINIIEATIAELEIQALGKAIGDWNESTLKEEHKNRLPIKGTAWLAGFPVTNVIIPVNDREDYIGPSMDAGFRLSKFSTARRLVVSVDLAWWLLKNRSKQKIRFDGRQEIRGLAEGIGYPILWMETKPSTYQQVEDDMLGRKSQSNLQEMENLCEAFIREFGIPRFPPFLFSAPDPADLKYSELHALAREKLMKTVFFITDEADDGQSEKIHPDAAELIQKLKKQ